jgi:hypothetical protein
MTEIISAPVIMTAAWSTKLPDEIVRIGISRGPPRRHPAGYRMFRALAPGPWFHSSTAETYVQRYDDEILGRLRAHDVVRDLFGISAGQSLALVCFERPVSDDGWCHRSLAARWITRETGIEVFEYGFQHLGCGDRHPLLPSASAMRSN